MTFQEKQYTDLVADIRSNGFERSDRTNVGTIGVFGAQMRFDVTKSFPLMTHRHIAMRIAFEEMMWFLRGETNAKILQSKKIHIWDGNTSREFLDKMGFSSWEEGQLGKGYGFQLRNFGGTDSSPGVDQLSTIINSVKKSPMSRRHIVTYWHPHQVVHEAALPPCHTSWYLQVQGAKLNLGFQMRSNDIICGLPYNLSGYGFLLLALSKLLGYEPGTLLYQGQDAHIYLNHLPFLDQILAAEIHSPPKVSITKELKTLDDLLALEWSDVLVENYKHSGKISVPMAI